MGTSKAAANFISSAWFASRLMMHSLTAAGRIGAEIEEWLGLTLDVNAHLRASKSVQRVHSATRVDPLKDERTRPDSVVVDAMQLQVVVTLAAQRLIFLEC
jgi:hypothetical protein